MVEEILEIIRFIAPEILEMKNQITTTRGLRELTAVLQDVKQARTSGALEVLGSMSLAQLTQYAPGPASPTPLTATPSESSPETSKRPLPSRKPHIDKK
jgi:hypothetical protein